MTAGVMQGKLSKLTELKGIGPALEAQLGKLGIHTLTDLCFHLPFRYEDRSRVIAIGALRPMAPAVIEGQVTGTKVVFGRRRSMVVTLRDDSGQISLRFYHFSNAQKNQFSNGTRVRCYGEPRRGVTGLEMYHPEYQLPDLGQDLPTEEALTPVYPATEGVTQQRLRLLTTQLLDLLRDDKVDLPDLLPDVWCREWRLPGLRESLLFLHQPPPDTDLFALSEGHHPAQTRLILEELLAHQLSLFKLRSQVKADEAPAVVSDHRLRQQLLAALPFTPTTAQQRVTAEITEDIRQPHPMLRLVQGDVGSGKTLVAALAACDLLQAGYQVALMAPTEILAEQHLRNLDQWFEPLGIRTGWISGKLKGKARAQTLSEVAAGQTQLIIGTHALFQDEVQFAHLGLVIIDEQHRFGVHQRLALKEKGNGVLTPHQLIMTATPIPRTLAMSAYADLDTSILDELPPGRTPVNTLVIADSRRLEVIERVRIACNEGRQAYWVCTLIEESEELTCQAAETTFEDLSAALVGLRVGLIHGRMKPAEKAAVMEQFKRGELQLLVATTVIEVGVDVPNASLMIIENPERLGLAQLHQLRGRVGRGSAASHCVLLYHPPLSQLGRERLAIMRETCDGFLIAEKDLELRGPGEMLGTRQTGLLQFKVADLMRDAELLPAVRDAAQTLLARWPQHVSPLLERWLRHGQEYGQV